MSAFVGIYRPAPPCASLRHPAPPCADLRRPARDSRCHNVAELHRLVKIGTQNLEVALDLLMV